MKSLAADRLKLLSVIAGSVSWFISMAAMQGASNLVTAIGAATPVLTNIAQVKQLTPEEAGRHYPVRIPAVVTYQNSFHHCFIQDATGAIFVDRKGARSELRPGELVTLEGITDTGDFAPLIRERQVEKRGFIPVEEPHKISFTQLASGKEDCNPVETSGVVRSVRYHKAYHRLDLELAAEGKRITARIYDAPTTNYLWMVDATIRLRGIATGVFNRNRQIVAGQIVAAGVEAVTITEPALNDPFAIPLQATRTLFQYSAKNPADHRVKVRGIVLYQYADRLFLRDESQGLQIITAEDPHLQAGDLVEVTGFPVMGRYAPMLEDAVCRKIGSQPIPTSVRTTVGGILSGKHDAELISLDARLVEQASSTNGRTLLLQADKTLFSASLPRMAGVSPAPLLIGSQLRLTGICSIYEVSYDGIASVPQSFRLLLRSPGDMVVLQAPPWWTVRRIIWCFGLVTGVFAGLLAWVTLRSKQKLRAHIQSRAEAQARFEAVLAERNRLARELHDSLEQGLVGIAFQLEAATRAFMKVPEVAARHLNLALRLVRKSHTEVRRSIWDLRAQALDSGDLPRALASLEQRFDEGVQARVRVEILGVVRSLPAVVENNLLRISQEAVTNAHKHAQAREILVQLNYQSKVIHLSIADDGCGFDVENPASASEGHFGLQGMRERAARIGGWLTVESLPGKGTKVSIEVSLFAEGGGASTPALENSLGEATTPLEEMAATTGEEPARFKGGKT